MSAGQVAERGGWGPFTSPKALSHLCIGGALACCEVERASRPSSSWFPLLGISGAFFVLGAQVELHRCVSGAAPEQCCSVWALASVLPCQSPGESGHCWQGDLACTSPCALFCSRGEAVLAPEIVHCGAQKCMWALGGVWCLPQRTGFIRSSSRREDSIQESQGGLDRSGE